jgi:hypothetical protein
MTTNHYLKFCSGHKFLLIIALSLHVSLFAATYQAESPANQLSGVAGIYPCSACAGGLAVGYLGKGSTLQFNGVDGGGSGPAQLVFHYVNGTQSTLTGLVSVNGGAPQSITMPPTGSWASISSATLTASLTAGAGNAITIGNSGGWVADVDSMDVTPSNAAVSSQAQPAAPASPTPSGNSIGLRSFGSVGQGGDDTAVMQQAINSTAARGQQLEIPAATYNVRPLFIPGGANILVDAGATVQATSGYGTQDRLITIDSVSNVTIAGTIGASTFQMRKSEYTSGEFRHCLMIYGASNVQVSGIACNNSGGDGLNISGPNSNITITDSTFDNNRRQGFTLIAGNGIFIRRCHFTNTNGTSPQDGIDIEPNFATDGLVNIHIEDSYSDGNAGNGVAIDTRNLNGSSAPVSVTFLRHHTDGNALNGYYATNEITNGNGGRGTILVDSSFSTLDQDYGAVASFYDATGAALTFSNLTVTNANQSGSNFDGAATAVKRGGGGVGLEGNVYFTGASIIDTTGKLRSYFTVRDYSNVGYTKIQFVNPGKLSSNVGNLSVVLINGLSSLLANIL